MASPSDEDLDLHPHLYRLALWVLRVGVPVATLVLAMLSTVISVALTWVWTLAQGHQAMGSGFYIALGVPIPISLFFGGFTLHLVAELERTRQRVHALAMTDPLTGVYNRRHFMDVAGREFDLAQRHARPLSLMLLDIDHFKRINDLHGHAVGDAVLLRLVDVCRCTLRHTDVLARIGGEEFAVLLPDTARGATVRLAERLRRAVADDFAESGIAAHADSAGVTVSIGVAEVGPPVASLDAFLRHADEALYVAKRAGRDRVHAATVDAEDRLPEPTS